MAQPQVPIDVDPEMGIWQTDGLPMIYLPRHFLVNMQKGIEAAIGPPPAVRSCMPRATSPPCSGAGRRQRRTA